MTESNPDYPIPHHIGSYNLIIIKSCYLAPKKKKEFTKVIINDLVFSIDFHKKFNTLIDSRANLNCIQEGLIPTKIL